MHEKVSTKSAPIVDLYRFENGFPWTRCMIEVCSFMFASLKFTFPEEESPTRETLSSGTFIFLDSPFLHSLLLELQVH